ncbi:hypothetical protein [Paenibacillus fonticola]|uniref:hypothetical protein n=1 Tax=Paenibacillus fonticola TaxID=379896 RepID=UPI000382ABBE|nr:hypothetical protein [Paenibacillus fonticola]
MKNKRLLALLLTLAIVFSMIPVGSVKAKAGEGKDMSCPSSKMVKLKVDMQRLRGSKGGQLLAARLNL